MVQRRGVAKASATQRFTVALPRGQYDSLKAIAEAFEPKLTLQYVLEYAVKLFLERTAGEKKMVIEATLPKLGSKT